MNSQSADRSMSELSEKATSAWVLTLASLASFMVALDALVVSTALSKIRLSLGASIESLEWTVNAYNLSFAVLLMTGAALGDRFGRRRMFVAGLALFAAASGLCALAGSIGWLIAARAVQGLSGALVTPLAMALLSAAFPPARRARALGIFSGVTGLAVLGGPVIGGAIAQGFAWQWIFWLNIPIAFLIIALAFTRIKESFGPRTPLDIPGLTLVTGAAFGLVWGLVRSNGAGWASLEVATALAAGFLLAIAFVAWEERAQEPMVPMRFFRSGAFSSGSAAIFFLSGSLYGAVFFVAQFLQTAQGYGPLGAGLRMLPWTGVVFVVAPMAGALVNRIGERPLVASGLFLQALGMTWLALVAAPEVAYVNLVAPLIIAGAGISIAIAPTQNAVMGSVASGEIGKASGVYTMFRFLGGVFGIAIAVAVFERTGGVGSASAFSAGFAPAIGVAAGLSLLGAFAGLCLPSARHLQALRPPVFGKNDLASSAAPEANQKNVAAG